MGVGNVLVPIPVTLGQGDQAPEAEQILLCPQDKVRTAHPKTTKLGRYISLVMFSTWLHFGEILSEIFLKKFFRKISNAFWELDFKVKYRICYISAKMVRLQQNKNQNYQLNTRSPKGSSGLILAMTLTLNFQGQIKNLLYLSQNWFDCHETKSKHMDWMLDLSWDHQAWPRPWPWPWIFKVKCGICYISAKNGPIAMKQKSKHIN